MRALVDLNVVLDVVQRREPHYAASASVLSRAVERQLEGVLPSHAVPTLWYLVRRFAGPRQAGELVDWLLRHFEVAEVGKAELLHARSLPMADFEDAVVAAGAVRSKCDCVVTRNIADFERSPVPAVTPEEFQARATDAST